MNPLIGYGLLNTGGNVLSSLFGSGGPPKEWGQVLQLLRGQLGKPAITDQQVNSVLPSMNASLAPYRNQLANQASQRVGLDSGAAWSDIMRGSNAQMQGILGNLKMGQMNTNADYQQNLLRMLAGMVS